MTRRDDYSRIFAWALDFTRAMIERPFVVRILLRWLMGRYAYREFIGMMDEIALQGYLPSFPYGLEDIDYHKESVPFDFGKEREPIPLKGINHETATRN